MKDFNEIKVLGKGAYAIVKEFQHKLHGQRIAVKIYDKRKLAQTGKLK